MRKHVDHQSSDTRFQSLGTLLPILIGTCLAWIALASVFLDRKTNFEDASALGAATTAAFAAVSGYPIHCSDSRNSNACIQGAKARGATKSVLWLGNSQLHSINQWSPGETEAVPRLFHRLQPLGLDLVAFSQPNASLQEHYVVFEYLRTQIPLSVVILPAVFDDTREEGLRPEIGDYLKSPDVQYALSRTDIGIKLLAKSQNSISAEDADTAGIARTLQQEVEQTINSWLTDHSRLWAARPEMRGELMLQLYQLRNRVFNIKPTTKRKAISGRYRDNLASLESTLASALSKGIKAIVYIAPLRNDVAPPYEMIEYRRFIADVEVLSKQYKAQFANLENLVPARLWGLKNSTSETGQLELDFMHFSAGGHELLADRMAQLVTGQFR
jgi:hypothetical protein